jgi:hypothetical protein
MALRGGRSARTLVSRADRRSDLQRRRPSWRQAIGSSASASDGSHRGVRRLPERPPQACERGDLTLRPSELPREQGVLILRCPAVRGTTPQSTSIPSIPIPRSRPCARSSRTSVRIPLDVVRRKLFTIGKARRCRLPRFSSFTTSLDVAPRGFRAARSCTLLLPCIPGSSCPRCCAPDS